MSRVSSGFFGLEALNSWQQLAADVTFYYKWGPRDAWSLTRTRLEWWVEQANRLSKERSNG
ncbi:hypothetical protein C5468_23735 [Photorhabdus luminescens subsp. mexicana]|uniref:GpE family phage tail protein n=1 Tax=Photorhabdus luminescens subsp. mexicana TaxID=2100167 RepID=A0A4R4IRJ0_PHOLU|nr:hypothetical protein C5468_23735 [Photorhabdus luminescens subsp. mexicana]